MVQMWEIMTITGGVGADMSSASQAAGGCPFPPEQGNLGIGGRSLALTLLRSELDTRMQL